MSSEYVTLSFFKSNHINYYYQKPFIIFPCPDCCEEARMNANNATWNCTMCKSTGTLITLIQYIDRDKKSKIVLQNANIYNPTNEIRQIRSIFTRLLQRNIPDIDRLYEKVNHLIKYYQEKNEKDPIG